jgi:hypothetical protein
VQEPDAGVRSSRGAGQPNDAAWVASSFYRGFTNVSPGARLAVQDDGNVVIYDSAGVALWAINT